MGILILIRGPAGVGKTTISKALADRTSAEIYHFDEIMEGMGLDYVPDEKCIPLEKFLQADEVVKPKIIEMLDNGRNVVIDGNFYHKEHIEDLLRGAGQSRYVFTLKASMLECMSRDRQRRHTVGEQGVRDVYRLVNEFDYGISIQTMGKDVEGVVEEILSHMRSSVRNS